MRSFESLTARGRAARLRQLGQTAIQSFGLGDARLSLVAESFNTMFRVRTLARPDYLLRVGPALRLHPAASGEVEAAWLSALGAQTDIPVPAVLHNLSGQVVTEASVPSVPEPRACTLLSWTAGRAVDAEDPTVAAESGRLLASLHLHAQTWTHILQNDLPVGDQVLYWDDEPRFDAIAPRFRSLFFEASARAQETIDGLWASPPHLPHVLHGDLTPNNLLKTRRGLALIDFQDLMVGFEVQDVATSLLPFQRRRTAVLLTEAFRAGYETLRPWPDGFAVHKEALFAARRLVMANLALNVAKKGVEEYIDFVATRLGEWMGAAQAT